MNRRSIEFTGRNTDAVVGWLTIEAGMPPSERWLLTRGMSAATGGQAWRYARDGQDWRSDITAAIYSPVSGVWYSLRPGDWFWRDGASVWVDRQVEDRSPARADMQVRVPLLTGGPRAAPWYEPRLVGAT